MKTFIEPQLIKKGDSRVKLGYFNLPPKVDCRIISEDNYQYLLGLHKKFIAEQSDPKG